MFPHSREYKGILPKEKIESVTTAEFLLPPNLQSLKEDVILCPSKLQREPYPWPLYYRDKDFGIRNAVTDPKVSIRLDRGDLTWKLDACYNWIHGFSEKSNFIKGSIYFRSRSFGCWEPFEFVKYFTIERKEDLDTPGRRIVEPFFPVELLDKSLSGLILEMTMKLEHFCIEDVNEQEAVLMKHRAEMNNALLPIFPKSDLRIKVGDEEFFVHMTHIKAFSAASEALSNYVDSSNWNWTNKMTPDSMRALLRFVYYDEVDLISTPAIAFHLLQFGHMYQDESLLEIGVQILLSFSDAEYSFPDIFKMYLFIRVHDEFQQLKKHFCGVLSRNVREYDAKELKVLVQSTEDWQGLEALIEILQCEKPPEPEITYTDAY